jgi:hypothetical protein
MTQAQADRIAREIEAILNAYLARQAGTNVVPLPGNA